MAGFKNVQFIAWKGYIKAPALKSGYGSQPKARSE